jgi:hypothetical protein
VSKKGWIAAAVTVAVLATGAVVAIWWGVSHNKSNDRRQTEAPTAVVQRTSLVAGLQLRGTLGYGEAQELAGASGVITKLPEPGSTHRVGEPLLEVEGNPVFLLPGDVPLWRDLAAGMSGIDVDTLRAALNQLGYDAGPPTAARPYDETLAAAIDKLYADAAYPAPSTRPDAVAAREEANAALTEANQSVAAAQQALRMARQGPPARDLAAAEAEVSAANRALSAARACTAQDKAENPGPGGLCDVAAAQDTLKVAQAGLADLNKPADSSAEQAGVSAAQAAQRAAQLKADQAALSAVGPKDLLIVPTEEMRVDQVLATLGQPATGPLVTWTSTTVFAQADLTEAQRRVMVTGAQVEVLLPDGVVLAGTVADVSQPTTNPETGELLPARARIDIEDQAALAENGITAVTITLVQDAAEDTLVVPVTALLALSEGGYAVELVDGTLVGVDIGLIQDTLVEVIPTYGQLKEGDEVVIA